MLTGNEHDVLGQPLSLGMKLKPATDTLNATYTQNSKSPRRMLFRLWRTARRKDLECFAPSKLGDLYLVRKIVRHTPSFQAPPLLLPSSQGYRSRQG